MTWPDWSLIAVLVLFLAVGARLGSLWTAACLGGGFLGALLADIYALPVAGWLGGFRGSDWLASAALFSAGAVAILVPGWILSKICKGLFLGAVDSLFGLFTGGVAAVLAVAVILLAVMPFAPKVESTRGWRGSKLVRPLQRTLESLMGAGNGRMLAGAPSFDLAPLRKGAAALADRVKG